MSVFKSILWTSEWLWWLWDVLERHVRYLNRNWRRKDDFCFRVRVILLVEWLILKQWKEQQQPQDDLHYSKHFDFSGSQVTSSTLVGGSICQVMVDRGARMSLCTGDNDDLGFLFSFQIIAMYVLYLSTWVCINEFQYFCTREFHVTDAFMPPSQSLLVIMLLCQAHLLYF